MCVGCVCAFFVFLGLKNAFMWLRLSRLKERLYSLTNSTVLHSSYLLPWISSSSRSNVRTKRLMLWKMVKKRLQEQPGVTIKVALYSYKRPSRWGSSIGLLTDRKWMLDYLWVVYAYTCVWICEKKSIMKLILSCATILLTAQKFYYFSSL